MSKIFKLKQTVSLVDTAKYLSMSLEEDVSVQDILQLALEKHIVLSARFLGPIYGVVGHNSGKDMEIIFDGNVSVIDGGLFDLSMTGTEYSVIDDLCNKRNDGSEWVTASCDGFHLNQGGKYYKLQSTLLLDASEKNKAAIEGRLNQLLTLKGLTIDDVMDYDNHSKLDADELEMLVQLTTCFNDDLHGDGDNADYIPLDKCQYQLLIRTSEVNRFIASLDGSDKMIEKEDVLSQKEKNTYLALINALFLEQKIDPARRGVSSAIKFITENTGISLSENTIRKILREVADISA